MKLDCFEEVKRLTSEMVAIPSINKEPHGETAVARYVYSYFMDLPYFKAHPEQVMCFQTKDDFVERHSTLAYVKGTKGTSNRTVILIGHIDTVGVDDFGTIREYAFKTDELPQKLKETFSLTPEVLADIESGDYMFGRGALDMKSGVAGHMYLVKYFSEHPEELDGNLVQIAECDEEDNSHGIITAIDYLLDLKKKEHFEYVACINADYSTNYMPGDENRYIYYGSIGKLLPCFVALGKESHVGSAFNAFDPNLLIAEVTRRMSLNTDLCDIAQGEVAIPPISLKQADTKEGYTVQTALTAFSYYNFFTHGMSPDVVLERAVRWAWTPSTAWWPTSANSTRSTAPSAACPTRSCRGRPACIRGRSSITRLRSVTASPSRMPSPPLLRTSSASSPPWTCATSVWPWWRRSGSGTRTNPPRWSCSSAPCSAPASR